MYNGDTAHSSSTRFIYDASKSASNEEKHGIDFDEAQALWDDIDMMEFPLEFKGEKRFGVIARYQGSCWTGVCTMREDVVRIISVRRSTKKEVSLYDRKRNDS